MQRFLKLPRWILIVGGLFFCILFWMRGIQDVSADTPPTPVGYFTGGLYAHYFENLARFHPSGLCPAGQGIVGFNTGSLNFLTPICQDVSSYWLKNGDDLFYTGGKVGIGKADPATTLDISGSVAANVYYFNTGGLIPLPTGWDSDFTWTWNGNHIVNTNSGNVGIGIMNPAYKLDVNGGFNVGTNTSFTVAGGRFYYKPAGISCAANQVLSWGGALGWVCADDSGIVGSALGSNYIPKWNGSDLVNSILYQSGTSIGINTTNPRSLLTVVGTTPGRHTARFEGNNGYGVEIGGIQSTGGTNYTFGSIEAFSGLLSGGTNLILNLSGGNVGIGTNTPVEALTVSGSIRSNETIYVGTMKHPESSDICIGNTCP